MIRSSQEKETRGVVDKAALRLSALLQLHRHKENILVLKTFWVQKTHEKGKMYQVIFSKSPLIWNHSRPN